MLEVKDWVVVIVTAVVVTAVAVTVGALLDIGFLRSGGWLVGVAVGIVVMVAMKRGRG